MYLPVWLLIIGAIVAYWIYSRNSGKGILVQPSNVEGIEGSVQFLKNSIFELVHFDSPHFIDTQNAFDAMEINYFRLKQRFIHNPEKVLEIARDWQRYVEALGDLKFARVMLDVDWSDDAYDKTGERMKEPSIIKKEIEKKLKLLLGKDWQEIPPDYFKREETMKKPDEKTKAKLGLDEWKFYYWGEKNLIRLDEIRQKEKEEKEKKEQIK
ncbi:hypothetical protein HYU96_00455 [Candidatus Daviesbacteria bacterium]|nr:hypothetical protein [Candidatus Daviesbacteria bacterium]